MANYTKPHDDNHEDSPQDWLNSALTFARALGLILKETEGVIVDVSGDMQFEGNPQKLIVFKKDNMIRIVAADEQADNVPEGTLIWMHESFSKN